MAQGSLSSRDAIPFRRVLVTGGDGFVGSHLVAALSSRMTPGSRLVTATRQPRAEAQDDVFFDLCQPDSVRDAIARLRPDAVIHLAAQASVAGSATAAAETWSINLTGSLALADALAHYVPDTNFLFVSSAEVYGETFNHEVAGIGSLVRPRSAYARSKAAAETMLDDVLPPSSRLIIARPANHSGRGQGTAFVIPAFANQIARVERGEASQVQVGDLESRRDFLDVADVVDAYILLLLNTNQLPPRSVFNIASGADIRVGEILDRLLAMSAEPIAVQQDPSRLRPSEVPRARIDNGALRQLGWSPRIALDTTLAAVLDDQRNIVTTHGERWTA